MITLVGIVGGIGSGKSAVANQFRRLGAEVLDGDRLGHEVLADPAVRDLLRTRWGDQILEPTDPTHINRGEVAKIVFGASEEAEMELRYLESVTHPRIRTLIRSRLAQWEQQHAGGQAPVVVIFDAPLLLEAGWDELCQYILYVDVSRETQLERLSSRHWSPNQLAAREARQLPLAEKRARAAWVIDNSGSPEELATQIAPIWHILTLPKQA